MRLELEGPPSLLFSLASGFAICSQTLTCIFLRSLSDIFYKNKTWKNLPVVRHSQKRCFRGQFE